MIGISVEQLRLGFNGGNLCGSSPPLPSASSTHYTYNSAQIRREDPRRMWCARPDKRRFTSGSPATDEHPRRVCLGIKYQVSLRRTQVSGGGWLFLK